jgi:hypothetical protein
MSFIMEHHNVKMNPQSDCTTPTKKQFKALYQAQRRANPVKRRLEQSSNTVQRRSARINQVVQDHESEQRAIASTTAESAKIMDNGGSGGSCRACRILPQR